ncbi:MAG: hypothetical protein ETSY1_29570 [Candidatus Entotheonella factor]|uniref:Major facilitator superfamily (MFS) profile domain-containing protein n=1 Tax=Entotheonella factor TaxID=1429438 RepID=W4LCN7_ENTF1|nr:MAG: hypothetical protein ETSY1_29570 [Candidatus Entotheonella factor]
MAKRPWIFYGWIVVICVMIVMALSSGTRMSFGVAMVPLSEQFGWTRTTLSTIALLSSIVTGLLQMIMGVLVDRFGSRWLLGLGAALLGIGAWLLTVATTVWQFGLAYGLCMGVGLAATQQVVAATLVANWFAQRRGFAQAWLSSAPALGWMVVVPANMFIVRTYDWTMMYRLMGAVLLIGVVPFVWAFIRNRPEDIGQRPYGESTAAQPAASAGPAPAQGVSLQGALRSAKMWKLVYLGFA